MELILTPVPAEPRTYTYEDYLQLADDGKRLEIIQGTLHTLPSPSAQHQYVLREFVSKILEFVIKNLLGIIFYAPLDIVFASDTLVHPDIIFILKENRGIIKEHRIQGAPDLVIEIATSDSLDHDRLLKPKLYLAAGVKEYWVVSLSEEKIEIFRAAENGAAAVTVFLKTEILRSQLLAGLEIPLIDIFQVTEDYFELHQS